MSDSSNERTRDIVVVGCSAGGVEALPALLGTLNKDLPGALAIVQHLAPHNAFLVEILRRASPLPVTWGEQGERVMPRHVYVAPPDVHMMFLDDHLRLTAGPRENHSRPSIDKLFRSAAAAHGSRVIGIVLTGMLDDGVAGLRAIREAGGLTVVQDPGEAQYPDLPQQAVSSAEPDHVLPLVDIGALLRELVGTPVKPTSIPRPLEIEAQLDATPVAPIGRLSELGEQTTITCPECGGPLWMIGKEGERRFRCYVGHVTTGRELLAQNDDKLETALWSAVRALDERATTLETLAADSQRRGSEQAAISYSDRAREVRQQGELARRFMHDLVRPR